MDRRVVWRAAKAAGIVAACISSRAFAADSFASSVVSYSSGSGVNPAYTDPTRALGEPTRMTGEAVDFPSVVSPFAAAWEATDLVSIGRGGSLVVKFDHAVTNDPGNPFGIDLLVFGNSFYEDRSSDGSGLAGPLFSGGGRIEVSADGLDWHTVLGVDADGLFPSLAYSDVSDPYSAVPGNVPTDFTRPVNPSFDPTGKTFSQIVAGYAGSGGGAGVDIGALGLSSISYVRITNDSDAQLISEIDGLADVTPVPAPWTLAVGVLFLRRSRR